MSPRHTQDRPIRVLRHTHGKTPFLLDFLTGIRVLQTPKRTDIVLLGAGHIHFEVDFHGITCCAEVEGVVGIPIS